MTDDNQITGDPSENPTFGSSDDDNQTDGGSFSKDDIEKMLKQNVHGQKHIKDLESEADVLRTQVQEMQQQLTNANTIDDLLDRYATQGTNSSEQIAPQLVDQDKLLSDLEDRVFAKLSNQEREATEDANWAQIKSDLQKKHGERYAFYVDERAKELDMTNEQMERLAKTSPKVFMEIVGTGTVGETQPTTSTTSTSAAALEKGEDVQAAYHRVATLKTMNTPEGLEARKLWQSEEFQKQYRQSILDKVNK